MSKAPLEVGWLLAGRIDQVDVEATRQARDQTLALMRDQFPEFAWKMPLVRQRDPVDERPEPVVLLERGSRERDSRHLDFVIVVTEADLKSHYKPFALGVPSKAMNVAVLSTARIDPAAGGEQPDESRVEVLGRRIRALALHLFGHLNDLPHSDEPHDFMYDLRAVTDLDDMQVISERAHALLLRELREEADVRLEETRRWRGRTTLFYVRALSTRGLDILQSVFHTRPWLFPFRLSKLTTAAVSALLVLMTTGEVWDLAMSQPDAYVGYYSVLTLAGAVVFILKRQRLLIRRHERRLSEQRVISNVTTVISVIAGMSVTYALLFSGTLLISGLVFSRALIESWAASLTSALALHHYFRLAGFVASLGLLIGALGASFESHDYFRHITYVDEET